MAITKTQVIGTVVLPDGTIPTEGRIIFALKGWDADMDPDGGIVLPAPVTCDLGGDGQVSVQLFTNSEGLRGVVYDVTIEYLDDRLRRPRTPLGAISLVGPGPHALRDLLQIPVLEPTAPSILAQVIAVQGLVDAAVAEATGAAGAAAEAAGAAGDAASAAAGSAEAAAQLVGKAETAVQPGDLGTAATKDAEAFAQAAGRRFSETLAMVAGKTVSRVRMDDDGFAYEWEGENGFETPQGSIGGLKSAVEQVASDGQAQAVQITQIDTALGRKADSAGRVFKETLVTLRGESLQSASVDENGFLREGVSAKRGILRADGSSLMHTLATLDGRSLRHVSVDDDGFARSATFSDGTPWEGAQRVLNRQNLHKQLVRWKGTKAKVVMMNKTGQSLSVDSGGDDPLVVDLVDPKRELMLNQGVTSGGLTSLEKSTRFVTLSAHPDQDDRGENGGQAILDWALMLGDDVGPLLLASAGRGGLSIASLSKGSDQYQQHMNAVQDAKDICDDLGLELEVRVVCLTQGEANEGATPPTTAEEYSGALETLVADMNTDIKEITGQTVDVHMALDQLAVFADGSRVAQGQVDAARRNPLIHLVGTKPDAFVVYGDPVHLRTSQDYYRMNELFGIAVPEILATGSYDPLWIKGVQIFANRLLIDYPVQHGQLVLDSVSQEILDEPYGYEAEDDDGLLTILRARVVQTSQVELLLNRAPTSGLIVRHAYRSPGNGYRTGRARSGLRTEWAIPSRVDNGKKAHLWAVTEAYRVDDVAYRRLVDTMDPLVWTDASLFAAGELPNVEIRTFNGGLAPAAAGPFDGSSPPTLVASDATVNDLPVLQFRGSELATPAFYAGEQVSVFALLKPLSGQSGTVLECRDGSGNGWHLFVDDGAGKLRYRAQGNPVRDVSDLDAWVLVECASWSRNTYDWTRIRVLGGSDNTFSDGSNIEARQNAVITMGAPHPGSTGGAAGSANFDLQSLVITDHQTSPPWSDMIIDHIARKANL